MASLNDDTLADKTLRFVIGALLGAGSGCYLAGRSDVGPGAAYVGVIVGSALITGLLAVVLGNAFLESLLRVRQ